MLISGSPCASASSRRPRQPHHLAVVLDDLRDDADRRQARPAGTGRRRPRCARRAPGRRPAARAAGSTWPGRIRSAGGGRRVGQHGERPGPVGGADPGGHARRGVDRDRVRGAARVLVAVDHRRQRQRVGPLGRHRRAQHAGRVPHGPADPGGRGVDRRPGRRRPRSPGRRRRRRAPAGRAAARRGRRSIDGRSSRTRVRPRDRGGRDDGQLRARASGHQARTSLSTYFASTSTSRFTVSPGCRLPRVVRCERLGDQRDGDDGPVRLVGHGHDGERDAVDRDRALLDDVARQRRRHREPHELPALAGHALDDDAGAVDVALDDVAAEAAARRDRPLQVDPRARDGAGERGAAQGLGHDVGGERAVGGAELDDRQADAVDGDRGAGYGVRRDDGPAHGDPRGVRAGIEAHDLAQLFHDAGEHLSDLPLMPLSAAPGPDGRPGAP